MHDDTEVVGVMIIAQAYPYTGNGLGGLPDAIEAITTHEINGQYELYFRYPVTGLHYEELLNGRIVMAAPDDLTDEQPFRIYRITKPLNGVVTVYARHLCYDLQGIVVEPFTAGSLTEAMLTIPTKCTPSSPITLQTTRTVASGITLNEPRPLWRLLGGQEGSLLDVYGGEWNFDKLEAKLVTTLGTDRGVQIRYGKNLTELEQDTTIEATYSGVYPFWYDEDSNTLVTLPEKVVDVTGSVVTNRVMTYDCSDVFEEEPTEQQLRDRTNAYIAANSIGNMTASWKVSFVDAPDFPFDKVMLGDVIHVFYEALGVNATARAVKTEYDVLAKRYKAVTIGRVKQNIAAIIVSDQRETDSKIKTAKSYLEQAIDEATYSITHGGGVFREIYDGYDLKEIVSLDDPDITRALSVWRWNNGGFGHSSTGYNGQYTLALLPDGSINAEMITTGILNANIIRAGILQDAAGKNSWNLQTGAFTITNGSISIETNSAQDDRITLNFDDGNGAHYFLYESPFGIQTSQINASWQYVANVYNNAIGIETYEITNGVASLFQAASLIPSELTFYGNDRLNGRYTRTNMDGYEVHDSNGAMGWLNNNGLSFYDANNNLTAHYPANGMNMLVGKKLTDGDTYTGRVINLGLVTASELNISGGANALTVAGAWLAYCCDKYPNAKQCVFEGVALANSYRMMRVMIYDTSDKSGIQPNVASGTMQFYNGDIVVFGANNYNVWTRNVTMSAQVYA